MFIKNHLINYIFMSIFNIYNIYIEREIADSSLPTDQCMPIMNQK